MYQGTIIEAKYSSSQPKEVEVRHESGYIDYIYFNEVSHLALVLELEHDMSRELSKYFATRVMEIKNEWVEVDKIEMEIEMMGLFDPEAEHNTYYLPVWEV